MAEVRYRLGKGAYDFAHKVYNRAHLLENPHKRASVIQQSSYLFVGFESGLSKSHELHGAGNELHRVTGGASRDSCTSVKLVLEKGNVSEHYCYGGLKGYALNSNIQNTLCQREGRNLPPSWSNVRFPRSFCTSRALRWGHGQLVFIRRFKDDGTRPEPLYQTKTGYYDILEVLPSATQTQVKTAYYKQSFVYHPDRNAGREEATVRFSEISEAYAVLGNKALRRKYDRGVLRHSDLLAPARARAEAGGSATPHAKSRSSAVDLRGGVYSFDKFFRAHYSEQLQRQRDARARREELQRQRQETLGEKTLGRTMEVFVLLLLLLSSGMMISLKRG